MSGSNNLPDDQLPGGPDLLATVPFWDDPPTGDPKDGLYPSNARMSPWDICSLAGIQLPGICRVQSRTKKRIDIKRPKGAKAATLTFNGNDPADVMITCRVWAPEHLNRLQSVMQVIQPKTNATSFTAIDINHPALTLLGIISVAIQYVDALQPTSIPGVWEMKLMALEYSKPSKKNVTTTADGSQNYGTVPHAIQANGETLDENPPPSSTDTGPFGPGLKLVAPGH